MGVDTRLRALSRGLFGVVCVALLSSDIGAQVMPDSGARVRTTVGPSRRVFTLVELRADSIVLLDDTQQPIRLALVDLDSLHVSRAGRSVGQRFWRGAGIGVLIGGAIGFLSGYLDGDDPSGVLSFSREDKALMGFVVLGGVGGLIGGIVGTGTEGHRWVPVEIRTARSDP